MMSADVDSPEESFRKQGSILTADLWRVGTGACECDGKTSSLDLQFFIHFQEHVVNTKMCFYERFPGKMWSSKRCCYWSFGELIP
jgi:hypothetical protein